MIAPPVRPGYPSIVSISIRKRLGLPSLRLA